MSACAGIVLGCGAAPAKSSTPTADSPGPLIAAESASEAGDTLAALTPTNGAFDPPREWVPALPGIFPLGAHTIAEAWNFGTNVHCRTASYALEVDALHAEHTKFAELASALQQDPGRSEAKATFGGAEIDLMRSHGGGEKGAALSVCTPTHDADRVAVASALMRRIPALEGHDVLLHEGSVSVADYERRIAEGKSEARVNVWLVGDEGARNAWLTALHDAGFVKDASFASTHDERSYSLTPKGGEYELQVAGMQ